MAQIKKVNIKGVEYDIAGSGSSTTDTAYVENKTLYIEEGTTTGDGSGGTFKRYRHTITTPDTGMFTNPLSSFIVISLDSTQYTTPYEIWTAYANGKILSITGEIIEIAGTGARNQLLIGIAGGPDSALRLTNTTTTDNSNIIEITAIESDTVVELS